MLSVDEQGFKVALEQIEDRPLEDSDALDGDMGAACGRQPI
jgi:hypothetical protein